MDNIDTVNLSLDEKQDSSNWENEIRIGKSEIESMIVAKYRNAEFFTMDSTAAEKAMEKGVDVIGFDSVTKKLLEREVVTEEQIEKAIDKIERKDNRQIDEEKIFS